MITMRIQISTLLAMLALAAGCSSEKSATFGDTTMAGSLPANLTVTAEQRQRLRPVRQPARKAAQKQQNGGRNLDNAERLEPGCAQAHNMFAQGGIALTTGQQVTP